MDRSEKEFEKIDALGISFIRQMKDLSPVDTAYLLVTLLVACAQAQTNPKGALEASINALRASFESTMGESKNEQ